MNTEIWKPVVGYEGLYEVSNLGQIRSLGNTRGPSRFREVVTLMRHEITKQNYHRVSLRKDGKYKHWLVHRLVAIAFIPNPNNYPIVNHKDCNPSNNHADNLEWCTCQYNVTYADAKKKQVESFKKSNINRCHYYKGLATKNRLKVGSYEKPVHQVDPNTGEILNTFRSIRDAERAFNTKHVSAVVNGRRPKAKGYFWKLAE
jgi:hypothetical protein